MTNGMNRRHFLKHVAGSFRPGGAGPAIPAAACGRPRPTLKKENKSLIILWMGGGPSHMDLWDLKPGAARPAASSSRSRPRPPASRSAKSCRPSPSSSSTCRIVRSLVTNEGSHERGTVLMNTGRQPNPVVQYPGDGRRRLVAVDLEGPAAARLHRRRRHRPAHRPRLPRHDVRPVHRPERRPAARRTSSRPAASAQDDGAWKNASAAASASSTPSKTTSPKTAPSRTLKTPSRARGRRQRRPGPRSHLQEGAST